VRVRLPHGREDKGLRFHGLRAQIKRHTQETRAGERGDSDCYLTT
jgi:hypothetical protein